MADRANVANTSTMEPIFETTHEIGAIEYLPDSRQLIFENRRTQLSRRENAVLEILVASRDRVVRRERIYSKVWGGDMPYRDRAVDVYVRRVRRKLCELAPGTQFIHTHFGIGYRFAPDP